MEICGKRADLVLEPCELCLIEGLSTQAEGLCNECDEHMCNKCFQHHVKAKSCRNHVLRQLGQSVMQGKTQTVRTEKCKTHVKENVKYFCRKHDVVTCGDCNVTYHHGCKMEFISNLANQFENSSEFKDIIRKIEKLETEQKENKTQLDINRQENKARLDIALAEISKFRKDINKHLDTVEKELISEANKIIKQNDDIIDEVEKMLSVAEQDIGVIRNNLDTNIIQGDTLFIRTKEYKPKLNKVDESISLIQTKNILRVLKFEQEKQLADIVKSGVKLGCFRRDIVGEKEPTVIQKTKKPIETVKPVKTIVPADKQAEAKQSHPITDKVGYVLKGYKVNDKDEHQEILHILSEEKGNHETRRTKRATVTRGTINFTKVMYEDEPGVPSYWNMFTPGARLKDLLLSYTNFVTGKKHEKVRLPQDSRTYSAIIKMINATFDPSKIGQGHDAFGLDQCRYSKLFVLKIERIENPELFMKFAGQKQAFSRRLFLAREENFPEISKLPNCSGAVKTEGLVRSALDKDVHQELNEVFLFHGTKKENVKVICNSGFDKRLGSGKAMFGQGIYGAECSMKADQYTDDKAQRTYGQGHEKKMFLMRMLLGNAFLCSEQNPYKFRRLPCTRCLRDDCATSSHTRKFGHLFDSIVGDNNKLFREFVVYDSTLCYPEYLITYERR